MSQNNFNTKTNEDEVSIDLNEIFYILRKWSTLIIIMTVLTVVTVWLVTTYFVTPVYQAKTTIMINQASQTLGTRPSFSGNLETVVNNVTSIPVWTMNTYVNQLKSPTLLKRVGEKLGQGGTNVSGLSGMISATALKDTNLIDIVVNHTNQTMVAEIANTITAEYLKMTTEQNQEQLARSVTFLDQQKEKTDAELAKANAAMQDFQSQPRGVAILDVELKSKSADLIKYDARLQMIEVEIKQLNNGLEIMQKELSETPQFNTIERKNYSGSTEEAQETNRVYLTLSEQIANRKATLAEKQGEYDSLVTLVNKLDPEVAQLQAELTGKRTQQETFQRELNRLQETSDTLGKKSMETQITKSIDFGDTSIVVLSEASVPTSPVKPNKKLNIALSIVLGFVSFTMLAFVIELYDNTLKTPEDIENRLGLPVIGVMPKLAMSTIMNQGVEDSASK